MPRNRQATNNHLVTPHKKLKKLRDAARPHTQNGYLVSKIQSQCLEHGFDIGFPGNQTTRGLVSSSLPSNSTEIGVQVPGIMQGEPRNALLSEQKGHLVADFQGTNKETGHLGIHLAAFLRFVLGILK